jgi:hypothetical protein
MYGMLVVTIMLVIRLLVPLSILMLVGWMVERHQHGAH